jgi:hypothetical protein
MVISKRIPIDMIPKRDVETYQRRTPPTAVPVVTAARTPSPVVVVVNPAAVVIGRPSPWFITHPSPPIWRTPDPIPISVGRPIVVSTDRVWVWSPNPSIIGGVHPSAVGVQIFSAPDVRVVILRVVAHPVRKISLTIFNPVVPEVRAECYERPVARVKTFDNEFSAATVAQSKPGGF